MGNKLNNVLGSKISINASFYLLSDVIGKGIYFLLIPLYTLLLTQNEYGLLGLTSSVTSFFNAFFTLQLASYVTINYFSKDCKDKKELISTIWFATILFAIFFSFISFIILKTTLIHFGTIGENYVYFLLSILISLIYSFTLVPYAVLRIREQARRYFFINTGTILLSALLSLTLVLKFDLGLLGILLGVVIGYILLLPVVFYSISKDIHLHINLGMVKHAVILCTPLVPHMLSHWGLNLSDRMIISLNLPSEDLGIYQLGYQIGIIYQVTLIAINNAWLPNFLKYAHDRNKWNDLNKQSTDILIIQTIIGLAILCFGKLFIRIGTPENYKQSELIYIWIVLGFYFLSIYQFYVNILLAHKKTRLIPISTLAGALVNISLNILFVKSEGIIIAAINTAIGYFVLCILIILFSQNTMGFTYDTRLWAKIIIIFMMSFGLILLSNTTNFSQYDLLISTFVFIIASIACLLILRENRIITRIRSDITHD